MKKCLKYGIFTSLIVLKEIIVSQRITSLDNYIRLITPQDNCPGVFYYMKKNDYSIIAELQLSILTLKFTLFIILNIEVITKGDTRWGGKKRCRS